MRSTQFDDHFPIDEVPEEGRRGKHSDPLCEALKRLGYAQDSQVKLYGEFFDLVSDPVRVGENLVFVDALDRTNQFRRVRIPRTIVQMAGIKSRAAQANSQADD